MLHSRNRIAEWLEAHFGHKVAELSEYNTAGTLGRYQREHVSLADPSRLDVPTIAWISAPALQALACN